MDIGIKDIISKKTKLMGILNITFDSFYDGGKYLNEDALKTRIRQIIEEGADIIDIGAQSTFVDREEIDENDEIKKVLDAIGTVVETHCNASLPMPMISVDTYRASVADCALKSGVNIINDVTAMRSDSEMADIVAKYKCPIILMYAKEANARTSKNIVDYDDIIDTLKKFFDERINFAVSKGVLLENIIIDPGLGFFISGNSKYSFEILNRLNELKDYFKLPILISPSRKSFLSLNGQLKPEDRMEGTLAATAVGIYNGADIVRTHDIAETRKVIETMEGFLL